MSKWWVDTDCMFISFDYINCRGIELVKSLNVYIIRDSRDYFLTILMFKSVHGIAPTYLSDRVVVHFDVNGYDTRGSDMGLYLPCCVKRLIGTVSCIWVANCGMIFPSLYKILPILNHSNVIIKYTNCSLAPDWFKIFALFLRFVRFCVMKWLFLTFWVVRSIPWCGWIFVSHIAYTILNYVSVSSNLVLMF